MGEIKKWSVNVLNYTDGIAPIHLGNMEKRIKIERILDWLELKEIPWTSSFSTSNGYVIRLIEKSLSTKKSWRWEIFWNSEINLSWNEWKF